MQQNWISSSLPNADLFHPLEVTEKDLILLVVHPDVSHFLTIGCACGN